MGTRLEARAVCAAMALLMLAPAAACSAPMDAELTLADCSDGDDNDGDGLHDCSDPDCQQLDLCRGEGSLAQGVTGTGLVGDAIGPMSGAPPEAAAPPLAIPEPSMTMDTAGAAAPAPLPATPAIPMSQELDPDTGTPDAPDAPDAPAACACADGEVCTDGTCAPAAPEILPELWRITELRATLPRSIDGGASCLDVDCLIPIGPPPFLTCGCYPDPQVMVFADGVQVAYTQTVSASEGATWPVDAELRVAEDTVVELKVLDDDRSEGRGAETVYYCIADSAPQALAEGTLGCTESFETDSGPMTYGISATIVPVE